MGSPYPSEDTYRRKDDLQSKSPTATVHHSCLSSPGNFDLGDVILPPSFGLRPWYLRRALALPPKRESLLTVTVKIRDVTDIRP